MSTTRLARQGLGALLAVLPAAAVAQTVTVATFDAAQHQSNGFLFGDFNDTFLGSFDNSNGLLEIDAMDFDSNGDFFGGAGSDIGADFDANSSILEVVYRIDPANVAEHFRVTLVDDDGLNTGTEYVYEFDLIGDIFDPLPTGEFLTFTQPVNAPLFSQDAFGGGPGDDIQNFGLRQIQVQSVFGVTDRMAVDIQSVKVIDTNVSTLVELTPATLITQPQDFTFNSFSEPGVLDQSNGNFVIDTSLAAEPDGSGGVGFNGLNFNIEATDFAIEVEAKLLPGNTAPNIIALLGDSDGDDSAPMQGSEDFVFAVPTSAFNEDEFSTFTIPLGSGSESVIETTFGFTNGGDGLQNFGLSQLQLQVDSENEAAVGTQLNIEVARISIVAFDGPVLMADFNGDGTVDLLDLDILGQNFGGPGTMAEGDANGDGDVDLLDLDILGQEFGQGGSSSVPEPTGLLVALSLASSALATRRR